MRKILFSSVLAVLILFCGPSIAQKNQAKITKVERQTPLKFPKQHIENAPGCDTLNFPFPANWSFINYTLQNNGGYVTGTNSYDDLQKADSFDVSATANTYLTKVYIAFAVANGPNLAKAVPITVLDGTSGKPGAVLGTVNLTLGDIKTDVDNDDFTVVTFNPAVSLPASKKFYVSVDMSNLTWGGTSAGDSLSIYSTVFDEPTSNQAWEQWDNSSWYSFIDSWGGKLAMYMLPFVSTNASCAITTPVKLSSFTGNVVGAYNKLQWTTVTEIDNTGFEIQRSSDGSHFEKLDYVVTKASSGNSSRVIDYIYTDETPLERTNYYRLKQVDHNGKSTFSNIVLLTRAKTIGRGILAYYPNPVKANFTLQLLASTAGNAMISVTNMSGVVVMQQPVQTTGSVQNISLNVSSLPKGTYFVRLSGEKEGAKFVKE